MELLQELNKLINENKNISIEQAYNNFLNYQNLRVRQDTLNYYQKKWNVLKVILKNNNLNFTNDINKRTYEEIIQLLKLKGYKNITINKFTDLLKQIFKVNVELNILKYSPIANIKKLKVDIPDIDTIDKNTSDKVINYLKSLRPNFLNTRNLLIIQLLKDTGARLNEIVNITLKNVKIDLKAVYLSFTKTNKPRWVFLTEDTINTLKSYLKWHNGNNYLLISKNGDKIKKDSIYHFIEKIKKELDVKNINPHRFRHTLATNLIKENVNLSIVMDVMGHTEYETTKRYIHVDIEHKQNIILNAIKKRS